MSMLIKNLEYLMYKKRISANQLQELTGVAQSTTTRILNGNTTNPRDAGFLLPKLSNFALFMDICII